MFFLILLIVGLFFFPATAAAHGMIWMNQYKTWLDGVQWNVVGGFAAFVVVGYFVFRLALKKLSQIDLLDYAYGRAIMKSRWYPFVFQLPALIMFGFIFYYLFLGSYYFSENPGAVLTWTLWWALLPLSFILIGRLWCAVCPFAWISDIVQKFFGKRKRVPVWLARYSFWIVDGIFVFITWFDRVFGMTSRPFITGLVFVGLLLGVVVCALLYERRAFCRYVCFLGNVAGTYSMAAPLELTSKNPEICKQCTQKFCFAGREGKPGCPFSLVIPSKEGNRFCTLCANCVKACPHDNIALKVRPFGTDFWRRIAVRFDESFFAKMLVGIVILQNIGMLTLWNSLSGFVSRATSITNETWLFTLVYFLTISIPLAFMFFTSAISAKAGKENVIQNFARFGYAFVAVDLAGHLAHNLNHFFGEGKTILAAIAGLFSGEVRQIIFQWFLNYGTVRVLQYIILGIGVLATIVITYRIAKRTAQTKWQLAGVMIPHLILLLALMALNFYIFSLPMIHRSQNII